MYSHIRRISGLVLTGLMSWFFARSFMGSTEGVAPAPSLQEASGFLIAASILSLLWVLVSIIYGGVLSCVGARLRPVAITVIVLQVLMGICVYLALREKGYSIGTLDFKGMAVLATPLAVAMLDLLLPLQSVQEQTKQQALAPP